MFQTTPFCVVQTEHAGAGKLPTVIGGRDLEEHTGTAHRDLEDLFAKGVAVSREMAVSIVWDFLKSHIPASNMLYISIP